MADDALADPGLGRDIVHHVQHHVLEDRAQAPGAGLPGDRLFRDGLERAFGKAELAAFQGEQFLILFDEGVLGPCQEYR